MKSGWPDAPESPAGSNRYGWPDDPGIRKNVILELGYFIGRLGRARVSALKRSGVEIASDFDGVVYTEFDERGAWKTELARELRGAGIKFDAEALL